MQTRRRHHYALRGVPAEQEDFLSGGSVKDTLQFLHNQTPAGRLALFMQGPRQHPTYRFEHFLDKHKGKKVTSMHIGKKPIISPVHKVLDLLSFGGFSKAKKKLGYDDVYHQYLLTGLDDGTFHKLERNHIIENVKATNDDFSHGLIDIPVQGKELYLDEMIKNAAEDNPKFWQYNGRNNNCQYFTRDMVEKNGLMPKGSKELVPQDGHTLLDSLPESTRWIPDAVTDFAGAADRATSMVANGLKGSFCQKDQKKRRARRTGNGKRKYKRTQ
jgi:hypothetical protein